MLTSSLKTYRFVQEKAVAPAETIKRVQRQWQALGYKLPETISIGDFDRLGLPVYVCKPLGEPVLPGMASTFGKGGTEEEALASALMELVERISVRTFLEKGKDFRVSTPLEASFPAKELLRPFDEVYHEGEILEELSSSPFLWARGWSLDKGVKSWVPGHWFYHLYGTTGWASGNTLEEALHQALCEVVERHSISKVVEERRVCPSILPESVESPLLQRLLSSFLDAGLRLFLKDFSCGFKIPTLAVVAHDPTPPHPKLSWYAAAGTHPDRELALARALIELAQHRAQFVYSEKVLGRPGGVTYCFPSFEDEKDQLWIREGERVSFEAVPTFSGKDFKEEIEFIVQEFRREGLSTYFLDCTHPQISIPAVMVSVPGARLNRPSTKIHPYVLLSRQLMQLSFYEKALQVLEKAFSAQPGLRGVPQVLCQAAKCGFLAGYPCQAQKYFEEASKIAPYLLFSPKFREEWERAKAACKEEGRG